MSKTKEHKGNILTEVARKKISRRSFIKWSSAIGATASASGLIIQQAMQQAGAYTSTPAAGAGGTVVDWRPTCCLVCHSWCAVVAGVDENGHVRKIEGQGGQPKTYSNGTPIEHLTLTNPALGWVGGNIVGAASQAKPDDANHIPVGDGFLPYACHHKGRICAKGNDGVEHLYDVDRIKYPLRRAPGTDRGAGKWVKISWEEALKDIANVLREQAGLSTFYDISTPGDNSLYALGTSGKNFGNLTEYIDTAREEDYRHRFCQFIGRNENSTPRGFTLSYGSPNHIEHTSICELGRHVGGVTMWGHHWSSPDHMTHKDGAVINLPSWNGGGTYTLHDDNDCDFHIEIGGNPAEAKIPHAAVATNLCDRRRKNLQGYSYTADSPASYPLTTRKGRIVCIDVRQSNTSAFADEYFNIRPGTDGALALAMFHYLCNVAPGSATLQAEVNAGHMGFDPAGETIDHRRYYGLFTAEEFPGYAGLAGVPAGKSLESVVNANGYTPLWAAGVTGMSEGDIVYLARALAGLDISGGFVGGVWVVGPSPRRFATAMIDGYRGPCVHSNGTQNYRAIRALQIVAANRSACHFWATAASRAAPIDARGGYNAPGAFQSDKQWDPWQTGGGPPGPGGAIGYTSSIPATLPASQQAKTGYSGTRQRIDSWDYERDLPRWRGCYTRWVDQNTYAAIRHSVGLAPYAKDDTTLADPLIKGPYYWKDWQNQTLGQEFDTTFKIEALLNHKNAPTYARPNQERDLSLLTAKDGTGKYRLHHHWAIDINVGDNTRFADIVLPDVSYLERWSERSGEGAEISYRHTTFYRMPVYETSTTIAGQSVPRHLYDGRNVRAIFYELARYIEQGGPLSGFEETVWNGTLYDSFKWVPGDLGSLAANPAYINDGEYGLEQQMIGEASSAAVTAAALAAGAADGFDYIRSMGYIWNTNDTPAYWRQQYGYSPGSAASYAPNAGLKPPANYLFAAHGVGKKLDVYNSVLDTMPDIVNSAGVNVPTYHTKADGTFHGTPVYIEPLQQTSTEYPLHLTTYKINVHTQSRTATCPRLQEITGKSWVVIHPGTANGTNPVNAALAADPILDGGQAKVVSVLGELVGEAKVTDRAQPGCVHISHSQGHLAGAFDLYEVSTNGGVTFGIGRNLSQGLNNPAPSPADADALAIAPSAPGVGIHPNKIITDHTNNNIGDGKGDLSTDPISSQMAWTDTKVYIIKP